MDDLALYLLSATQDAALACTPWVGRGEDKSADAAAVAAFRKALDRVPGQGTVVIGEGVKDDAPMLYEGEAVGAGEGSAFDLAVDPLEGTKPCARGAEGALVLAAAAAPGTLFTTPGWYMDKFVVGPEAAGRIDIEAPLEDNLQAVANALGKRVNELAAVVLDKPRHEDLVARLRAAGVQVQLIPEGDVLGSLMVLLPTGTADLLVGVGGAPEGVVSACVVRLLGGDMQGKLAPQKEGEADLLAEAGQRTDEVLTLDRLCRTDRCCFVTTAVTGGALLQAPARLADGWRTHSFVATEQHAGLLVEGHIGGARAAALRES